MDLLISMGVNVVLESLKDKRNFLKFGAAFAKVYVAIERVAATNPALTSLIELARKKA